MSADKSLPKSSHQRANGHLTVSFWTFVGRLLGAIGAVLLVTAPLTLAVAGPGPLLGLKCLLALVLLCFYLATNRDFFARLAVVRASTLTLLSLFVSALVLTLTALVNLYAYNHPKDYDFTHEGIYTLSPQTLSVLHNLQEPVTLLAFFASQEPAYAPVEETLERYARQSSQLSAQMIDPQARPDLAKKYNITERGPRVVVTAARANSRAKNLSEEEITNAIVQAVAQTHKTVYFLTGHGEGDTANVQDPEGFALFARAIETEGYSVRELNLLASGPQEGTDAHLSKGASLRALEAAEEAPLAVPNGVDVLIVLAPNHKMLAPEVAALTSYVRRGGRLYVFEEPQSISGLAELLAEWHIVMRDDLIVDTSPVGKLLGLGVASPILHPLDDGHAMTQGIQSVIMTTARSLVRLTSGLPHVIAMPLLQSAETAWGETETGEGGLIAKDSKDHMPPLYTAMAAYLQDDEADLDSGGRVVAVGDSDWVSNRFFALQNNADLAINAINWLAEESDRITIRPKLRAQSQLSLNDAQLSLIKFISMDLLPVLLVAWGLGLSLVRRQR